MFILGVMAVTEYNRDEDNFEKLAQDWKNLYNYKK